MAFHLQTLWNLNHQSALRQHHVTRRLNFFKQRLHQLMLVGGVVQSACASVGQGLDLQRHVMVTNANAAGLNTLLKGTVGMGMQLLGVGFSTVAMTVG